LIKRTKYPHIHDQRAYINQNRHFVFDFRSLPVRTDFCIQSFWLNMLRSNRGCVYVCVYVYVYVCDSATAQTDEWVLMKVSTNDLTDICKVRFSRIFKFRNRWRYYGLLYFFVLAQSRSQFCSDFLQNWRGGRKMSSADGYLKLARSVGNFYQYGGLSFRDKKKIKMSPQNTIFETKQMRCLFRLKLTCWFPWNFAQIIPYMFRCVRLSFNSLT